MGVLHYRFSRPFSVYACLAYTWQFSLCFIFCSVVGSYGGNYQHSRFCVRLGCLWRHEFCGVCIHLEYQIITTMHVQNSIFSGEVFQIKVADGLVHSLRSCQKIFLYTAIVFMGARVLRSSYLWRLQNEHSSECTKWYLHW